MTISSTTIVFTQYILLEWLRRKANDPKTICESFYVCCNDIQDIELCTALSSLVAFLWKGSTEAIKINQCEKFELLIKERWKMYIDIINRLSKLESSIAVVGLGYVGYPLAKSLANEFKVIGYDIDSDKINKYKALNFDDNITFSCDPLILKRASIYIVAVATPVLADNLPDLSNIISASKLVGKIMQKDAVVIYESTVYPGATEQICIPILEKESGYKCILDFKVGYSPERLSPGDAIHGIKDVVKVVSATDKEALYIIRFIYEKIITAGVFAVSTIQVAEAIKVIENSQRDVNIAFMNEMAMMLEAMEINSREVFEGMQTKWNALNFRPGLVGGHCISVDPYYLMFEAEKFDYHSVLLSLSRDINNAVSLHVAEKVICQFLDWNMELAECKVLILGITFKEDCDDIRNSKVVDIYNRLVSEGIYTCIYDPVANSQDVMKMYGIFLLENLHVTGFDCVIIAVAHDQFYNMEIKELMKLLGADKKLIYDVKGIVNEKELLVYDVKYMHL